jgi:hypothetical protein
MHVLLCAQSCVSMPMCALMCVKMHVCMHPCVVGQQESVARQEEAGSLSALGKSRDLT